MKQEERRERRIREIFSAAMEEFGTNGYENVTMDSLCTRHGLSKGVLYHYFSNRDELFLLYSAIYAHIWNKKARSPQNRTLQDPSAITSFAARTSSMRGRWRKTSLKTRCCTLQNICVNRSANCAALCRKSTGHFYGRPSHTFPCGPA